MSDAKKPMTKSQIVAALADKLEISKKDVDKYLDAVAELAYSETKKKGKFTLPGFGILKLNKRPARKGRNPATGETINIAAKTVVKMTLAKSCKEAIVPPKK